jgi:thymidylate synthase (FAD)
MKIITEPSIYLVGRQTIDHGALSRFLTDHECESWGTDTEIGAEKLVETAGRLCYMSFSKPRPGGNAAYVGHLLDVGHGSVLEHAVFNLIVSGVSRSFTHELVRHRAGFGFSQLSQRFVDESDVPFVVPPGMAEEVAAARRLIARFSVPLPKARDVLDWANRHFGVEGMHQLTVEEGAGLRWLMAMEECQRAYLYLSDYLSAKHKPAGVIKAETDPEYAEQLGGLIEMNATERRKKAREAARSVLPNAAETKIFVGWPWPCCGCSASRPPTCSATTRSSRSGTGPRSPPPSTRRCDGRRGADRRSIGPPRSPP